MDTIIRNARIKDGEDQPTFDIGIDAGRIAAIEPNLTADGGEIDAGGRLVSPGFIESHIHLDKSCILDRCKSEKGDLEEAIEQVGNAKAAFSPEDVRARAIKTLEKCILNGTTHMRTQLEVDPGIGLRGFEGVLPLIEDYRWAIDIEICVFPQEGLLNNPGTDELMVEAQGIEQRERQSLDAAQPCATSVHVYVEPLSGRPLVGDSVEAREQDARLQQIGVDRPVHEAEFEPPGVGNTDHVRTVVTRIGHRVWRPGGAGGGGAGVEPLIAVDRRVEERAQGLGVVHDAAEKIIR